MNVNVYEIAVEWEGGSPRFFDDATIVLDVDLVDAVAERLPLLIHDDPEYGYVITIAAFHAVLNEVARRKGVPIGDLPHDEIGGIEVSRLIGEHDEERGRVLSAILSEQFHRALASLDAAAHTSEHAALDAQIGLARFWASDDGLDFAAGFILAHNRREDLSARWADSERAFRDPIFHREASDFSLALAENAREATTWWVAEDMRDLATWAASSIPDVTLSPGLAPTAQGFMLIDGGLRIAPDKDGGEQVIRAIVWSPGTLFNSVTGERQGTGLAIQFYVDRHDPRGGRYIYDLAIEDPDLLHGVPRELLYHATGFHAGDTLYGWDDDVQGWIEENIAAANVDPGYPGAMTNPFRWLIAAWALLDQKVVIVRDHSVPRATRRRAERANMPTPGTVRTVAMREAIVEHIGLDEEVEVNGSRRNYSHRFYVRPHWRRLANADGTHRFVPVVGYVKGPADKPFVAKNVVYEWRR